MAVKTENLTEYSIKIEDRNANRLDQERVACIIEALATAIPEVTGETVKARNLLTRKVKELVDLCDEEVKLLARLEELREKKEM